MSSSNESELRQRHVEESFEDRAKRVKAEYKDPNACLALLMKIIAAFIVLGLMGIVCLNVVFPMPMSVTTLGAMCAFGVMAVGLWCAALN